MAGFGDVFRDWGHLVDNHHDQNRRKEERFNADVAATQSQASGLDPNRALQGSEYFKDDGVTWKPGADRLWESEHGIDQKTGDITGPAGAIPAGVALKWQAIHDQAVWRARYRMAQDALRFQQGATGLLTSYRAGGGAALQAGVHQNLAQIQMNRAQMMQPLDLLGDYRRDQLARAGRSGRSESTIGTAIQGLGAVLSVIPGLNVVGAALAVGGGALAGHGNSRQAASFARAGGGGGAYGGQQQGIGAPLQLGQMFGNAARNDIGAYAGGSGGPSNADLNESIGRPGAFGPTEPSPNAPKDPYGSSVYGPPASMAQAQLASGPGQGGQGGQPGGMKQMAGGPQMGIGAGGMPPVGVDGRFDANAYAANGMATSMAPESMQLAMSENMAHNVTQDPTWAMIGMAIDRELAMRAMPGYDA